MDKNYELYSIEKRLRLLYAITITQGIAIIILATLSILKELL